MLCVAYLLMLRTPWRQVLSGGVAAESSKQ